jgi:nitroimidazol reductase NimA-like FMN-containing flavoprotein (pyridoxamine 5'-phosphate oxidase superfamily)
MSDQEVSQEIAKYAQGIGIGVLAYVRADFTPVQRTFGAFAVSGNDILLATGRSSAKVSEIAIHPNASFFLENRDQKIEEWKSALYFGKLAIVTGKEELRQAVEAIGSRSAFFKNAAQGDGLKNYLVLRLQTREIEWLDYAKGRGHIDKLVIETEASISGGSNTIHGHE